MMLSEQQCELARTMTGDDTDSAIIITQYSGMSSSDKSAAYQALDTVLKIHDIPFDEGIVQFKKDFANIASEYNISPAALFCVYMEMRNK